MEGISFASYGFQSAISIQSNMVHHLMAGSASVQAMVPGEGNNPLRTELMQQNGVGQHINMTI